MPAPIDLMTPPAAVLEVFRVGSHWRLVSSDNLFSGTFTDRRSALRHAEAEAECHPGHVVVVKSEF
jgi:hypothetical protein